MSRQIASGFFMLPPCEFNSDGLYQVLLRGIGNYQQLGDRLIRLAEQAHAFRQFDEVEKTAQFLINLPITPYQAVGCYFSAVALKGLGKSSQGEIRRMFELAASSAPDLYKRKAILSLGTLSFNRGDFDSTRYYLRETCKAGGLSVASLQAIRGLSILKSVEGNHTHALRDLESILPVIKYAPAHIYFDLLNSYAVELGEVGRTEEARNVMRHVLASPFAFAYPEWRETADELQPARRLSVMVAATPDRAARKADDGDRAAMVTVAASPDNVLALRGREPDKPAPLSLQPGRVLNFIKLKKKMAEKGREKHAELCLDDMNLQDMWFKLIEMLTEYQATEAQMRAILHFAVNLFSDSQLPDKPSA